MHACTRGTLRRLMNYSISKVFFCYSTFSSDENHSESEWEENTDVQAILHDSL